MVQRTSKKLWSNSEWAVTTYGIECITEYYPIEKKRLLEGITDKGNWTWFDQIKGKAWSTPYLFLQALIEGIRIHHPKSFDDERVAFFIEKSIAKTKEVPHE